MTIAKWFAAWAEADEADLSNLKVQKLLYYAQGHHLARHGAVLFSDPIQAWSHGPVVKDVYHEFKRYGSGDVSVSDTDSFEWSDVDDHTTQFLLQIWDRYGSLAAWALRNMTHREPPWLEAFKDGSRGIEISVDAMQQFFSSRPGL